MAKYEAKQKAELAVARQKINDAFRILKQKERIVEIHLSGSTYQKIADEAGVTRQAVAGAINSWKNTVRKRPAYQRQLSSDLLAFLRK